MKPQRAMKPKKTGPIWPTLIFHEYPRTQVDDPENSAFRPVGYMMLQDGDGTLTVGTGTMISPQCILTAAHNLWWDAQNRYIDALRFIPSRSGAQEPFGSVLVPDNDDFWVPDEWKDKDQPFGDRQKYDYGTIRLEAALEGPGVLDMKAATEAELQAAACSVTGYPGDKPEGTMWTAEGQLQDIDDHNISYRMDTADGESGGPVTAVFDGAAAIVGVHSGANNQNPVNATANLAVRLNEGVIARIQQQIAN